jgi:AraC family transcriptional regulator
MLETPGTLGIPIASPCEGAALSLHAPGEVLPWHEHRRAYVCVVLAGAFVESAGSQEGHRRAGDVVLHLAGERHADRFGPDGGCCLNLQIPAAVKRNEVRRADAVFRTAAENLAMQAALGAAADRLAAESAYAEMRASLLGAGPRAANAPIDRVIEALDDAPQRDWTLAELAALAGRHPTHLARAFREKTGLSIGAYRRRRKVAALALALRCTDEPLGRLAQAHGFADQAHMTREFRRAAGCAPGEWRRRFR